MGEVKSLADLAREQPTPEGQKPGFRIVGQAEPTPVTSLGTLTRPEAAGVGQGHRKLRTTIAATPTTTHYGTGLIRRSELPFRPGDPCLERQCRRCAV